jgi:hypothetical protein
MAIVGIQLLFSFILTELMASKDSIRGHPNLFSFSMVCQTTYYSSVFLPLVWLFKQILLCIRDDDSTHPLTL